MMNYVMKKIMLGAMYVFWMFVKPYSMYVCSKIAAKKITPIKNELLKIPAIKLAAMIREQQISSETVIRAYIERIKEVVILNAVVESRFDEALEEARNIDKQIQSGTRTVEQMQTETPLLGLPLTVKESIMVKGMINQAGRVFKKKQIALEDAPVIKNAKRSGAVILAVTNTPELCLCWETYNNVTGITLNPYDMKRTPGGSSGGESALLGAGASLLAIGSDVAGSCRLPAMFTGVYGHKPTPFICSPYGHSPCSTDPRWGTFFTTAPMARYVEDLPFFLNAIREADGPQNDLLQKVNLKAIKYYYCTSDKSGITTPLDKDIENSLLHVANHFNAKEADIKQLKNSLDVSMSAMLTMDFDTIFSKAEAGEKPKTLGNEFMKKLIGASDSIAPSIAIRILQIVVRGLPESNHKQLENTTKQLKDEFLKLLKDDGVMFYPSFPNPANEHFGIYFKLIDTAYQMIFNTLGFPVTQVKTGFSSKKLPIGIQVVTTPGNDHLSMAVAKEISRIYGGWVEPSEVDSHLKNKQG
ncbi:unnamed protein product [Diamesa serratosioi]